MNYNNAFLVVKTSNMIARRYVDGKFTGERVTLNGDGFPHMAAYLAKIDEVRLNGMAR